MTVRAGRPEFLRIGWADWKVSYLTSHQWEKDKRLSASSAGEVHASIQEIFVCVEHTDGMSTELVIKEIVLHEILHAVMHVSDLRSTILVVKRSALEEVFAGALTGPLLEVLRDNPVLVRWLAETEPRSWPLPAVGRSESK